MISPQSGNGSKSSSTFQRQYVPESEMTPDWYVKCIQAVSQHYNSTTYNDLAYDSRPYIHKYLEQYRYFFGEQSSEGFQFMQEAAPNVNLPAKWVPGKKIMSLLEHMRGSFLRVINTINITTFSTTESTMDEKSMVESKLMFDLFTEELEKSIKKISGVDPSLAGIGSFKDLETIKRFMQYDYKTANEVIAKELGDHVLHSNHYRECFLQLFTHMLITNCAPIKIYVENGMVKWRVVSPLTFTYDQSVDNEYGRKMQYAGEVRFLTVPQILEEFQGKLSDKTLAFLKEADENPKTKSLREIDRQSGSGYYKYQNGVLHLRVTNAEWMGVKNLRVEKNEDKYGNQHISLSPKKNKGKNYPVQCVRYGVLIGDTHLVEYGEAENQYRRPDSLQDTMLNYHMFTPGHLLGHGVSVVEKLQAHQDNIDLYKYKIQLAIGRDKGKVYTIDTSQLDGVNDINEIATIAQTVGIIPYNSYNDETGMSKPSGKYFDVIDLSLDPNVKSYLMLIERETKEMEEIVNIPQMALGQQQAVVGLGVQQNTIAQSTLGTLNYYDGFLKFIENLLQHSINVQKLVLDYDSTMTKMNIVGQTRAQVLSYSESLKFEDFGVYIDANDMIEPAAKQRILTIAQAMAQNGLMDMLDFVKLDKMDTYTEMSEYLEQSLRLKKLEQAQKEQLERQMQQEQQQAEIQAQQQQQAIGLAAKRREASDKVAVEMAKESIKNQ